MIIVTVSGINFTIPESGERNWGVDTTAWIQQVSTVLSGISAAGDISYKNNIILNNNQVSVADVTGMKFDNSVTRSAVIEFSIYRVTTTSEVSETGTFYVTYKSTANTWDIATAGAGAAGITFSITSNGQVQYTSTSMGGLSYSGKLAFRARSYNPGS